MHTLTVDTTYTIDLILSNPLAIEIPINEMYFLTDCDSIFETKDVINYKFVLKIKNFKPIQIDASATEFMLNLNIETSQIGKFKIIGYIINSFNSYSKILFSDLVKKEVENKKNNSSNNTKIGLHTAYHIEVLPKLPIVSYFAFKNNSTNECFQVTSQESTSISCYTGEK